MCDQTLVPITLEIMLKVDSRTGIWLENWRFKPFKIKMHGLHSSCIQTATQTHWNALPPQLPRNLTLFKPVQQHIAHTNERQSTNWQNTPCNQFICLSRYHHHRIPQEPAHAIPFKPSMPKDHTTFTQTMFVVLEQSVVPREKGVEGGAKQQQSWPVIFRRGAVMETNTVDDVDVDLMSWLGWLVKPVMSCFLPYTVHLHTQKEINVTSTCLQRTQNKQTSEEALYTISLFHSFRSTVRSNVQNVFEEFQIPWHIYFIHRPM